MRIHGKVFILFPLFSRLDIKVSCARVCVCVCVCVLCVCVLCVCVCPVLSVCVCVCFFELCLSIFLFFLIFNDQCTQCTMFVLSFSKCGSLHVYIHVNVHTWCTCMYQKTKANCIYIAFVYNRVITLCIIIPAS